MKPKPSPDRIRYARQRAALTQQELAGLLGVSLTAVSWWETGRSSPQPRNLRALARATSQPLDFFFEDDAPAVPPLEAITAAPATT